MTRYVETAAGGVTWMLRDAAIRGQLARATRGSVHVLERSARNARLAIGEHLHARAASIPIEPAEVDPLCDQGVIPEVDGEGLDARLVRRGVQGNGALVVRGLLDGVAIERLCAAGRSAVDAASRGDRSAYYDPVNASRPGRDRVGLRRFVETTGGVLLADSPVTLEVLLEEFARCGILAVVREYVGGTLLLSGAKATLRSISPSVRSDVGWHQDGAFLGPDLGALNVWVALTDCGIDAPTMMMLPRRLREIAPVGGSDAAFEWSVGASAVEAASEGFDPVVLKFEAGDAILFDEMNLHRTFTAPTMSATRLAIESWFFAAERMPDDWAALAV